MRFELDEEFVPLGVFVAPDGRHLAVVDSAAVRLYALPGNRLVHVADFAGNVQLLSLVWSPEGDAFGLLDAAGTARVVRFGEDADDDEDEDEDEDEDDGSDPGPGRPFGSADAVAFAGPSTLAGPSAFATLHTVLTQVPRGLFRTRGEELRISIDVHDRRGRLVDYYNEVWQRSGRRPSTTRLTFSPTGDHVAYTHPSGEVVVRRVADWSAVWSMESAQWLMDLCWVTDVTLVSLSAGPEVSCWSVHPGRPNRVLELAGVLGVEPVPSRSSVLVWTDQGRLLEWFVETGDLVTLHQFPFRPQPGTRPVSVAGDGTVVLLAGHGPEIVVTTLAALTGEGGQLAASTYANAKILLLGDSGVGKSGLALVLAGEEFRATDSTHARQVRRLPLPAGPGSEQREVLLWDLAGQPGYRIVHQLHLGGAAAAVVVFDSRSETTPLAGIGHWARALRHAAGVESSGDALTTFLVSGRSDRGVVSVSDERVQEIVREFGFSRYLSTSAREGWGVDELRRLLLEAIDWSRIPVVTSSLLFAAAKSFVVEQKAAGVLLSPLPSLQSSFLGAPVTGPAAAAMVEPGVGADLLEVGDGAEELREVFAGCVARLESAGLVKRLAFGDLVLLQPELLDVYASAIVNAARQEPDGLGSMLESRVLGVDFPMPSDERVEDRQQERLLVIATVEELVRHEIILREGTEEGVQLVFPSAFRRDLPAADGPTGDVVEFAFEGPVANVYATLVVRLSRSDRFPRVGFWQSAAQFDAGGGGRCTVHLALAEEGRGVLQVGYDEKVPGIVREQFERFVMAHLIRRATPGTVSRERRFSCGLCGTPFAVEQVARARDRGRDALRCPVDDMLVSIADTFDAAGATYDPVTTEMDASADGARAAAAASSVIRGKEATTDFDVFLCHSNRDKPAVREVAQRLRERGVLPWLDEDQLRPGMPWQRQLEQQISSIRAAAVFLGPDEVGPWHSQELEAFLREFVKRSCPVIPVLLPGAEPLDLPIFLGGMTWVDLRGGDGIDRLVWGITGRRPAEL
jgi:GTPase SAR1 family protein